MKFIVDVWKGIAIGAGAILPGISSGVLCVIFGIYETLVNSVLGIFKDFKKNFFYLLPFVIGCFVGVILFGNLLNYFFLHFEVPTKLLFIGLVVGSIPALIKQANTRDGKSSGFRLHYLLYTLISFLLGLLMVSIENTLSSNPSFMSTEGHFLYLVLSGFCMSIGVVIPGVSSTVILMCLGSYSIYLQAVATLSIPILFPMGIGCVIGGILFLRLIQLFLKKFHCQTFYCIIGFVLGSVLILLPDLSSITIPSLLLMLLGYFLAMKFEK